MKRLKYIIFGALCALPLVMTTSCSDEPDKDNFYTFTGEMMSDYINNRAEYSDFAYIVDQADLTDLLPAFQYSHAGILAEEGTDQRGTAHQGSVRYHCTHPPRK